MKVISLSGGAKNAHQTFTVNLDNNYLEFSLNYVSYTDQPCWNLDIYRDSVALVSGVILRCGGDMLADYRAGIGQLLLLGKEPTLDNLGTENTLVWIEEVGS